MDKGYYYEISGSEVHTTKIPPKSIKNTISFFLKRQIIYIKEFISYVVNRYKVK